MNKLNKNVPLSIVKQFRESVNLFRQQELIRWKPKSALRHLIKRIDQGQLPFRTTLGMYEQLTNQIVRADDSDAYVYLFREQIWYAVLVASTQYGQWLVMFAFDTTLETSFRVENAAEYLTEQNGYYLLGKLSEVLNE